MHLLAHNPQSCKGTHSGFNACAWLPGTVAKGTGASHLCWFPCLHPEWRRVLEQGGSSRRGDILALLQPQSCLGGVFCQQHKLSTKLYFGKKSIIFVFVYNFNYFWRLIPPIKFTSHTNIHLWGCTTLQHWRA